MRGTSGQRIAPAKGSRKVQDSLDRISTKPPFGGPCFAAMLQGEGKEFLAAVEARIAGKGYVNKTLTLKILREEFGVSIGSTSTMGHHLDGRCACKRRQALLGRKG